jgi:hypothetical protein
MNVFLAIADQQIAAPRKAQMRAAEKRAADKEIRESEQQHRIWARWRRERVEALLAGLHGVEARTLIEFLKSMTLASAPLIEQVARGPWRDADADTRFLVLGLIDAAIIKMREANDLSPFDDALPGEPPTAFQIIWEML